MATDFDETLARIVRKTESLTDRYVVLSEVKKEADGRIAALEDTVGALRREVARLKTEVEYLTVVNVISPTREDIDRSRAILSGLVQEINRCIADLSE